MTARDLARIIREGWLIIVAATLLFTAAGIFYSATRTPLYQATSTLAVSACIAVDNVPSCDPVSGMTFAVERAAIYASTGSSAPVLRMALEETSILSEREVLARNISVTQANGSPLLEIHATWSDPAGAAELSNVVAAALIDYSRDSVDFFGAETTQVQFSVISEAIPPTQPMESNTRTVALAFALGLALGLGLSLLRWLLDPRIRDRSEAESLSGLDVLTTIPVRQQGGSRPPTSTELTSAHVAEFHQLRTVAASRLAPREHRVIAIVSPVSPDAASIVTRGLVDSFASTRMRVGTLRLHEEPGAQEKALDIRAIIDGPDRSEHSISDHVGADPLVLDYDGSSSEAAVMLATPQFTDLLSAVREAVDVVIIDAAPASTGAAMIAAARHADAVMIVVTIGVTTRAELTETIRDLKLIGIAPVGIAALARTR